MKHIVKLDEPDTLAKWKAFANDNWQPIYDDMPRDIKTVKKNEYGARRHLLLLRKKA